MNYDQTSRVTRPAHVGHSDAQLIIVTGYSGAGKKSVLHALEDSGFYCVDNLPIDLLDSFFQLVMQMQASQRPVALGLDIRGAFNVESLLEKLRHIRQVSSGLVKIIFVTCPNEVLIKRFQETRRMHPLAQGRDLLSAIMCEKQILQPLCDVADMLLDTAQLTIHELRRLIRTAFARAGSDTLLVTVMSFGFKYGLPPESNFVYDIRSLPNPYFIPELREFAGTDLRVQEYLFAQVDVQEYWNRFVDFSFYAIERSYKEGRFFMNIGIGCTGGRHRSVAFAERFARLTVDHAVLVCQHRDINGTN